MSDTSTVAEPIASLRKRAVNSGTAPVRGANVPAVARAAQRLHALALVRGKDLLRWDQFVARTPASPIFNWACPSTHHALWSLLRKDTTAPGVMHAAALVLATPIARGPSPANQHTRGGIS